MCIFIYCLCSIMYVIIHTSMLHYLYVLVLCVSPTNAIVLYSIYDVLSIDAIHTINLWYKHYTYRVTPNACTCVILYIIYYILLLDC